MRFPTDENHYDKFIMGTGYRKRRELRSMKKAIITLSVIGVLIVAVAAFAHGGYGNRAFTGRGCDEYGSKQMRGTGYSIGPGYGHMWRSGTDGLPRSGPGHHLNQRSNIPSEMVAKMKEIEKLHLQMRMEFIEESPDREKLMELHNRIQDLRREMADWYFRESLERIANKPAKVQ